MSREAAADGSPGRKPGVRQLKEFEAPKGRQNFWICLKSRSSDYIRLRAENHMRRSISFLALLLIATTLAQSQVKTVAQYIEQVRALSNRGDVKAADAYIDRNHESILREWITLTEINAPSGQEQERAKYIENLLRRYRLDDIHYDSAGNLIAVRKGT